MTRKEDSQRALTPVTKEALRLLQIFISSGLSTKWRLTNSDGVVSLLLQWGNKKQLRRNSRVLANRKKTALKRKSKRKKSRESSTGQRGDVGSSLVSSPVYSEFSSDDPWSPRAARRMNWGSVCRSPLSSESVFSGGEYKSSLLTPLSSRELSAEEAFLCDSLKCKKTDSWRRQNKLPGKSALDQKLLPGNIERTNRLISSDEVFLCDSIKREGEASERMPKSASNEVSVAEEMLQRHTEKDRAPASISKEETHRYDFYRVDQCDGNYAVKAAYADETHIAREQLSSFSDEALIYESLRRKKDQIRQSQISKTGETVDNEVSYKHNNQVIRSTGRSSDRPLVLYENYIVSNALDIGNIELETQGSLERREDFVRHGEFDRQESHERSVVRQEQEEVRTKGAFLDVYQKTNTASRNCSNHDASLKQAALQKQEKYEHDDESPVFCDIDVASGSLERKKGSTEKEGMLEVVAVSRSRRSSGEPWDFHDENERKIKRWDDPPVFHESDYSSDTLQRSGSVDHKCLESGDESEIIIIDYGTVHNQRSKRLFHFIACLKGLFRPGCHARVISWLAFVRRHFRGP